MITVENRSITQFFGLVLILSLPFYALGISGDALPFARSLPISALMAVVPMAAALGLIYRSRGSSAGRKLFIRAFDFHRIPNLWWAIVAASVMPVAFALTAGMVWLSGTSLPGLNLLPATAIIPAFALFFLGAVTEEIGWQGYAYPALTQRGSALTAALIIGVVWALWHVIPFALMGRSAVWIFWQGVGMVCMRIIIVWLVVNAGQSIAVAVLFHMMSNSVWGIFANFDTYYDPRIMCIVLLAAVIAVVTLWGPTMRARFR
jgi:uncharacterized protein